MNKKPTSPNLNNKQKPAVPKKSGGEGRPRSFDIIPPGKVMPSSTARPVITSTQPLQSDNTLAPPSAPLVRISLAPSEEDNAASDDRTGLEGLQPEPLSSDDKAAATSIPISGGREMLGIAPEAGAIEPGPTVAGVISARQLSGGERVITPPDVTKPAKTEHKSSQAGSAKAAGSDPKPIPGHEQEKGSEQEPGPDIDLIAPSGPQEHDPSDSAVAAKPDEPATFKDALHELGTSTVVEAESQHHEAKLYSGKPVIVVHEPHPVRSVLRVIVWFIICLAIILLILNFLLDAGVVSLGSDIPHTNLLEP